MRLLALLLLLAPSVRADEAGAFDYYVLSLSWSPNWCALEGEARGAAQCRRELGWMMHGLWPQHEIGYPERCTFSGRDPSRRETGAMADLMGSGDAAWYQWKKHGRCAGLPAEDYFVLARRAYDAVARPAVLRQLDQVVTLPASVIEEAFLEANDGLFPDAITITCRDGHIQEARICLGKDLSPRACGRDVVRDCTMSDARLLPIR